jgi:hypothetical protein
MYAALLHSYYNLDFDCAESFGRFADKVIPFSFALGIRLAEQLVSIIA